MSKGSSPRNNHTDQFRDNFDNINWSKHRTSSETLMGCIRQTMNSPLSACDNAPGPDDSNLYSPRGVECPPGDESETRFF